MARMLIIILVLLHKLVHRCLSDSITIYKFPFYEGDYEKILLNSDECINIPDFLFGKTNAARVNVNCVALFDGEDCTGKSVKLKRNTPNLNNLRKRYAMYKFKSVIRCDENEHLHGSKHSFVNANELCLEEHNDFRAMYGLPALTANYYLEKASQKHIERMHKNECHKRGDPHRCRGEKELLERFEEAGYTNLESGAENIAVGYGDCSSLVEGWMNSPSHRKNILKDFKHLGCGKKLDMWACGYASPFPKDFNDKSGRGGGHGGGHGGWSSSSGVDESDDEQW